MTTRILGSVGKTTEMFITGGAGTGKTTRIADIVDKLLADKVAFQVVAYTNKARDVLRSKMPEVDEDSITTLHSWLKKRPTINSKARSINAITISHQYGEPQQL